MKEKTITIDVKSLDKGLIVGTVAGAGAAAIAHTAFKGLVSSTSGPKKVLLKLGSAALSTFMFGSICTWSREMFDGMMPVVQDGIDEIKDVISSNKSTKDEESREEEEA